MLNIETFTFFPQAFAENTYVVWDDDKNAAVIDPGCYYNEEFEDLKAFIASKGLKVEKVLNTHCHIDHVLGNRWVCDEYDAPLWAPEHDIYNLEMSDKVATMYGLRYIPSPDPKKLMQEGEIVNVGNESFEVLFVPGHTAGHIALYHAGSGALFSGDVLFRGSTGRTDLPGGDAVTLLRSIKNVLFALPDNVVVYAGHMEPTTIGTEKKYNPVIADLERIYGQDL